MRVGFRDVPTPDLTKEEVKTAIAFLGKYVQEVSGKKASIVGEVRDDWLIMPENATYYGYVHGGEENPAAMAAGMTEIMGTVVSALDEETNFTLFNRMVVVLSMNGATPSGQLEDGPFGLKTVQRNCRGFGLITGKSVPIAIISCFCMNNSTIMALCMLEAC